MYTNVHIYTFVRQRDKEKIGGERELSFTDSFFKCPRWSWADIEARCKQFSSVLQLDAGTQLLE